VPVTRAELMEFPREFLLGLEAPGEVELGEFPRRSSRCEERGANEAAGAAAIGSPRGAGAADGDTAPSGGPKLQ
jgi:hypothetical protein